MRPTRRGWAAMAVSGGLYAAGRVLGTVDLTMLAAGVLAALVVSAVTSQIGRPSVSVRRTLHPRRLHAGTRAHAEIELTNRGSKRTPLLAVTDRFATREVRFAVPSLKPGDAGRAAYRVPTHRRGVYEIGPLEVAVTDPLGLFVRPVTGHLATRVTVLPRITAISALPATIGRDLVGGAVNQYTRAPAGDEFHSLREYAVGDDLRRVHWKSTARTGRLMLKEHDVPWQHRVTVMVDDRNSAVPTFETLVEAAASVTVALSRARANIRLLTLSSGETGFGTSREHHDSILERLAVVEPVADDHLGALVARLHRQAGSGALVVFTTAMNEEDLLAVGALARRFSTILVIRFVGPAAPPTRPVPGIVVHDVTPGTPFAQVWKVPS